MSLGKYLLPRIVYISFEINICLVFAVMQFAIQIVFNKEYFVQNSFAIRDVSLIEQIEDSFIILIKYNKYFLNECYLRGPTILLEDYIVL